jgi:hypothetical protein
MILPDRASPPPPPTLRLLGYGSAGWVIHEEGCPFGDELVRLKEAGLIVGITFTAPTPCTRGEAS